VTGASEATSKVTVAVEVVGAGVAMGTKPLSDLNSASTGATDAPAVEVKPLTKK
jgi:hypothetical protein